MTQQPERDAQGFIVDLNTWTPTLAIEIASEEGIALTDDHWEVITLLRNFYMEFSISPAMRILVKIVKEALGEDKGNSIYLLTLFPQSPAKLASKISGLPKPTNCL